MENRLFEYMNRRIGGEIIPAGIIKDVGPVITISRQTGCGASRIAWAVCEEFNKNIPSVKTDGKQTVKTDGKWSFISREILLKSAEHLNLDPKALNHVISDKDRGVMDQIVDALSTHSHKSDEKIMKTIQEVISQFGNKGNVVIVGRGGANICRNINRSLHIRIEAPVEWRIAEIARRMDFSKAYAQKHDTERELLVTKLFGKKPDNSVYDVELNRSRFSEKEIVDAIVQLAIIKGVF
jgi:cytidylate kinase